MQKRPSLKEQYALRRAFFTVTMLGSYRVWLSLGNYMDFAGGRNKPHRHSYYEACLVLGGQGTLIHMDSISGRAQKSGQKYDFPLKKPLKKGDLFLTRPGIVHEIVSHERDHLKIHFVYFSFEKLSFSPVTTHDSVRYLDDHIQAFLQESALLRPGNEDLAVKFRALRELDRLSDQERWRLLGESQVRDLVLDISDRMSLRKGHRQLPVMDNRLRMAIRFMEDNVYRRLSVDEIAFQASTSPRTLRRLIREHFNVTVVKKSLELRIEASAAYLIAHPEKSVAEAAAHFGFDNPSDFGRNFKQICHMSPGAFRRNRGTTFLPGNPPEEAPSRSW